MTRIHILVMLIFLQSALFAQNYIVEMVQNLNPGSGSNPRCFTEYNGSLYFFANDGTNGHKIFSITGNGLPLIGPNTAGNAVFGDGTTSTNRPMGVLNNKLFLPVLGNPLGREPYTYDGVNTPALLMDISPGNGGSAPAFFLNYNHKLYFQATSPTLGSELWVHDSATNTTQCLSDINPGALPSGISFITLYNNKLYFAGSNGNDTTFGNTGSELYRYDPVTNTVSLVADINPGYLHSNPTALTVANNKLYFVASEPVYGKELYEYDGIAVTRLTDVNPGAGQGVYTSDHSFPTYFNNCLYFAANEANSLINLGKYDLSTNTTSIIYCAGNNVSGIPRYFKVFDNKLFFSNYSDTTGLEPWCTDGLTAPYQVWDVNAGLIGSNPMFYTEYDSCLYFNAYNDTSTAEELFRLKVEKIIVDPSGISEYQTLAVKVSPNPVADILNISVSGDIASEMEIALFDVLGRKIFNTPVKNLNSNPMFSTTMNLESIQSGMYFVVVKNTKGQKLHCSKIYKQ